jgi:hypothetical protein
VSWEAIKMVIRLSREPGRWTDAEFRVLINLADRLNEGTGQLNPSTPTIARDMGRAPDPARGTSDPAAATVRKLLAQLQAKGELERGDSKGGQKPGRRYNSQPYRLTLRGAFKMPTGRASGTPLGRASEHNRASLREQTGRASGTSNLRSEPRKEPRARDGAAPDGAVAPAPNPTGPGPEHIAAILAALPGYRPVKSAEKQEAAR